MIQSTLVFARRLKSGEIPEAALIAHLVTHDLIFARDGFRGVAGSTSALVLADGTYLADGTALAGFGSTSEVVEHGVIQIQRIEDGDEGQGVVSVLPSRRRTATVTVANATRRMSELLNGEVLAGADAEIVLTFPGLDTVDRLSRFQGEISREILTDDTLTLELRAA